MAIRTLVAAAALVAFTTPAFAQSAEEVVILDESVSTSGLLAQFVALGGTAAGFVAAAALVGVIVVLDENDETVVATY